MRSRSRSTSRPRTEGRRGTPNNLLLVAGGRSSGVGHLQTRALGMVHPSQWYHRARGKCVKRAGQRIICVGTYSCCRRLRHLLREGLEFPVQHLPSLPFLLLQLDFVFVSVTVLAFPVTRFVELDVRCLAEELDILPILQYQGEKGWVRGNLRVPSVFRSSLGT